MPKTFTRGSNKTNEDIQSDQVNFITLCNFLKPNVSLTSHFLDKMENYTYMLMSWSVCNSRGVLSTLFLWPFFSVISPHLVSRAGVLFDQKPLMTEWLTKRIKVTCLPKYLRLYACIKISSTPAANPLAFLKSKKISVSTWSNVSSYQGPAEWNLQSLRLRLFNLRQFSNKLCNISEVTRFLLRMRCFPLGANKVLINLSIVSPCNDLQNGSRSRHDQSELSRDKRYHARQTGETLSRSLWVRNVKTSSQMSSGRISIGKVARLHSQIKLHVEFYLYWAIVCCEERIGLICNDVLWRI